MMGLAHPWILALAVLPVLAWFLLPARKARGALRVPASVHDHLLHQSGNTLFAQTIRPGDLVLKSVGWLALIIALAGPFAKLPAVLTPTGRDIVVAFDLSASMAEQDMAIDGRKVARIDVIRDRLGSFIRGARAIVSRLSASPRRRF